MPSRKAGSNTPASDIRTKRERLAGESFRTAYVGGARSRAIEATPAGADRESLRTAYLELLKLCLCDLAGASTLSVTTSTDSHAVGGEVFFRELSDNELELRINGIDWPWAGLTMVGMHRLDDLQRCIEAVVSDGVEGDLIEAGAWRGGASILMRATLDSLGAHERTVWVADSFQGLPAPDVEGFPLDRSLDLSSIDFLAVPIDEVRAYFGRFGYERGVRFVPGFFDETLPGLRGHRWSVIRLDGDTYESTWVGLESLYRGLSVGGYVVIDDYRVIEECRRAVEDFRRQNGITEPIEEIDISGARWRRERAAPSRDTAPPAPARAVATTSSARAVERRHLRIPSQRELELERELAAAREHLHGPRVALRSLVVRAGRRLRRALSRRG